MLYKGDWAAGSSNMRAVRMRAHLIWALGYDFGNLSIFCPEGTSKVPSRPRAVDRLDKRGFSDPVSRGLGRRNLLYQPISALPSCWLLTGRRLRTRSGQGQKGYLLWSYAHWARERNSEVQKLSNILCQKYFRSNTCTSIIYWRK